MNYFPASAEGAKTCVGVRDCPPPPTRIFFFFFFKWCNLVHSRAYFSLHNLPIFCKLIKNVAFASKSEKKPKKNLKRDNVSISRCAYASFSQIANLLRSFINITQGSYLLPGIINRPGLFVNVIYEDQVLYAKPKNEVLFERIKLLYAELSPFPIQHFMVQLSQILNIRHLEI